MQIHPGSASGRGIHQTRNRTAHASEPELNPRNSLQHIEKLSIAKFQQESPLVQMQQKRRASEPCRKAESGSQLTHNKRVARISATTPVVQIPDGFGNTADCKCALKVFLARVSTKHATEQHMHLNQQETRKIHCNSLRNFPLQGFSKNLPWFRCSGKGEHLNRAERQNPAAKPLATNALQDLQQLRQRFRYCNNQQQKSKQGIIINRKKPHKHTTKETEINYDRTNPKLS